MSSVSGEFWQQKFHRLVFVHQCTHSLSFRSCGGLPLFLIPAIHLRPQVRGVVRLKPSNKPLKVLQKRTQHLTRHPCPDHCAKIAAKSGALVRQRIMCFSNTSGSLSALVTTPSGAPSRHWMVGQTVEPLEPTSCGAAIGDAQRQLGHLEELFERVHRVMHLRLESHRLLDADPLPQSA